MMDGKKTYLVAIGMVLYAVGGFFSGNMDANTAVEMVGASGMVAALRHGIAKK